MMIMADGGSALWPGDEVRNVDDLGSGQGEDLAIDLDMLVHILEEPSQLQSSPEDFPYKNLKDESASGVGNQNNLQLQNGFQILDGPRASESEPLDPAIFYPSHYSEASDAQVFDYAGSSAMTLDDVTLVSSSQISSHMNNCSGSFRDWYLTSGSDQGVGEVDVLQSEIPSSAPCNFDEGECNHVSDNASGDLDVDILLGETGAQFRHLGGKNYSKDSIRDVYMESSDGMFGRGSALSEDCLRISETENDFYRSMDVRSLDADVASHNVPAPQSTFCHNSDINNRLDAPYSVMECGINSDTSYFIDSPQSFFGGDFCFDLLPSNEVVTANSKDEMMGELKTESTSSISEISMSAYSDVKGLNFKSEANNYRSPISGNFSSNVDFGLVDKKPSGMPFNCIQSAMSKKQLAVVEGEKIEVVAHRNMICHSDKLTNELYCSDQNSSFYEAESQQSSSGVSSIPDQKHFFDLKDENRDITVASMRSQVDGVAGKIALNDVHLNLDNSVRFLSRAEGSKINKQPPCVKGERDRAIQHEHLGHISCISSQLVENNLSASQYHVDDDSDICILENISQPACSSQSLALGKVNAPSQHSAYNNSIRRSGPVSSRFRANDERFIFRAALQDISQPKSEACPPEGALAVPLLRHQRIALSWMIQKETSGSYCSGGILADDQGLGKTVSTIALILKEKPPSIKVDPQVVKKEVLETLDLDDDDDEVTEVDGMKRDVEIGHFMSIGSPRKSSTSFGQSKGRPAAGTLVVCPTSVLRQWAEELHKKVTSKANLSVLVYHGSNRTKDPCELAKYDVVLTTYSIVSLEVPKQPIVDEDDVEKGEGDDVASLVLSYGKKRKYPPSSGKKGSRNKKRLDAALLESVARPLAKVAWFRVVLDEAQSIKNHRTQVARACWGLRAKRRWCLSGTPIQNAIDDLYSYFRFLRYDPYAVYSSFCSTIKIPIQRNPAKGYKKLQLVLKTIMLRRTKGTQIDGKPIINLPPKVVQLKKVDFTDEERDFYTKLEADSRAQFNEYAAAGTVKQNYVNILLMLLRLRQACDHPLLVRGYDSNSLGRSSFDMARKLSREKQTCLLNCLEASLAICGICNDPPEDAVVSICGHVFCNQCICEHLTGDDNQCPTSKCKVRLNTSSVFSKATLHSSLSDQPVQDGSGSEPGGAANSCRESLLYNSSKIRAALEVLQSLTKPKDGISTNGSSENSDGNAICPENFCSSGISVDDTDKKNLSVENVKHTVKVVGEKAIVFSQWTRMLDLLEACLKTSSIQYRRLDGTMSVVARDKAVKDFNTLPEVSVMIMSLKAASLGLNMVAACHVLLLDLWWNPTTEDQAIDRAHRIGQTRPVTVLRLTVKDTVEDRILALQQKKREMVASAFGEDETGGRQTRLTVDDLKYLFMV